MRGPARAIIPPLGAARGVVWTTAATRRARASAARPSAPPTTDFPIAPDRVHEALQLELERVGLGRLKHQPLDHVGELGAGARPPVAPEPHELAAAGRQIEREVPVGLEEPQPADPLAGDP